jgi:hypothetical protein
MRKQCMSTKRSQAIHLLRRELDFKDKFELTEYVQPAAVLVVVPSAAMEVFREATAEICLRPALVQMHLLIAHLNRIDGLRL